MKPTIYLTDPEAMLKARLNQPRASSEQARVQFEAVHRASEAFALAGKREISKPGLVKARA